MKVLIVEDQEFKRKDLISFLQEKKIEFEICEYVHDAQRYIFRNEKDISGIILDLGLESSKYIHDYNLYNGLDIIYELNRTGKYIPVLINSTTDVGMLDDYPFVYGQRTRMESYEMLEKFITFLKNGEEQ